MKKNTKKMYLDETILSFLGVESSCTQKPDTYTMEDLDEYDEWIGFLEDEICTVKKNLTKSWFLESEQEKMQEDLKTLNRELQICRTGKKEAVKWLKKNNLFNVGEKSTMEVCYS